MEIDDRHSLTITLRLRNRPVVLVGEGPVADELRAMLKRAGAFVVAEGAKAAFAVVIDDPGAVSRLKVRGAMVYAVDRPDLCDFILTRTADRPPPPESPPRLPEPVAAASPPPEPVRPAPLPPPPKPPKPAKPPKPPKPPKEPRPPRTGPTLAARIAGAAVAVAGRIGRGAAALGKGALRRAAWLLVIFDPLFAIFGILSGAIRTRAERARAQPLSLDVALAKGGPLDPAAMENAPVALTAGEAGPATESAPG
jgi:hypothetical protein